MSTDQRLDPVATTSRLTAALRAAESRRPDRLFDDPFAARLAGPDGEQLLASFGANSTIAVRTRFFDDAVGAAGVRQLVVLAAGMDSRAYRLDFPSGSTMFEVDRPEVLALKARLLGSAQPRCTRYPVGADLGTAWTQTLREAGFDPLLPTCWLVEGLTQYLAEPDVLRLLDSLSGLSAPGSLLLLDIVGRSLLDSPAMASMLVRFAEHDAPWIWGTDRPEDLLVPRGWAPEVTLFGSAGTKYGRWPYPEAPRHTPGVGQGYLVTATR